MHPDLDLIGKRLLSQSGGQPASAFYNGTLYLFAFGDGVITARPCAAVAATSTLSGGTPVLFYLYKTMNPNAGWTRVGSGWMASQDAQQQMTEAIVAEPRMQFGGYEWDGQSMTWKFYSSALARAQRFAASGAVAGAADGS
jgi:hypothetical protein